MNHNLEPFSNMPEKTDSIRYKHLFIIDDDEEDQEIFMEAVREVDSSITCTGSTSGEEAIEQLEHHLLILPNLIFLDLNMPKSNGKQILKQLKGIPSLKNIPVIMYSTSFAPRDIEELQELGAVFHLIKPARFDELCRSLHFILTTDWYDPQTVKAIQR